MSLPIPLIICAVATVVVINLKKKKTEPVNGNISRYGLYYVVTFLRVMVAALFEPQRPYIRHRLQLHRYGFVLTGD